MLLLAALLSACTCAGPSGPAVTSFSPVGPNTVGGRFVGQEDAPLDPRDAIEAQARCPTLRAATATRVGSGTRGPPVLSVHVVGERLDSVQRVQAGLPDGTLAEVRFVEEPNPADASAGLRFPVMCERCEVWLGIRAGERMAACFGHGYSLRVEDGRIVQ